MSNKFGILKLPAKLKATDFPCDTLLWITVNPIGTKDGENLLTGSIASTAEAVYAIDSLIKDLQALKKQAKNKLKTDAINR